MDNSTGTVLANSCYNSVCWFTVTRIPGIGKTCGQDQITCPDNLFAGFMSRSVCSRLGFFDCITHDPGYLIGKLFHPSGIIAFHHDPHDRLGTGGTQ